MPYLPPGWPPEVSAPGSPDWEETAVAWLLDQLPEYREHPMVCRWPVILASIARHMLSGALEGTRDGYRTVRTELGEKVPPHAVDAALKAYRDEGFKLRAAARAAELIERALRGERWTPSL